MTQSLIIAGDGSSGPVISPGNDGTIVLQAGLAGAKVNAVTYTADGTPTFLKPPINLGLPSMVKVNTASGFGSTNTAIRRFTNITNGVNGAVIQGNDITFADSAALGASFTINTAGIYAMSYYDQFAGAYPLGISLNSANLTTVVYSLSAAETLVNGICAAANNPTCVATTQYLAAGSVVRAHCQAGSGLGATGSGTSNFIMTKVG
jgi:hypothetical protein